MIVKMQKIVLLCATSDREVTLEALRALGVMHIDHVKRPEGEDLEQARARFVHLKRALEVLTKRSQSVPSNLSAEDVVEDVWKLIQRRKELQDQQETLQHEQIRMLPFGSFEPSMVQSLAQKGIILRLYHAGIKQALVVPEGACLTELSRDKTNIYFSVVGRGEFAMNAQEVRLPEASLNTLIGRMADAAKQIGDVNKALEAHAGDYAKVASLVDRAEAQVQFLEVRSGMGALKPIIYLKGFCPEPSLGKVRYAAKEHGWGLVVTEPTPEDQVPTLLSNPNWVKPIKPLLDFIGIVPGYNELDL
ncbi:MAG: hypothetical protein V2A34_09420, partial [Lentisphaerota bacterium]